MRLPAGGFDHFRCGRATGALQEGEDFVFGGLRLWRWWGLCGAVQGRWCRCFRRSLATAFFQPVTAQHAAGFLRDRGGNVNAFAAPDFPSLMHEPARVHARGLKENTPLFIVAGRLGIALGQQHFSNIGGEIGAGHIKPSFRDGCIISMKASVQNTVKPLVYKVF